jgi:hypothetical protein
MAANVVFKISGGKTTFLVNEYTKAFIPASAPIKRASHVEPLKLWQACIFRALRAAFGDEGRVANWTRDWKCQWVVDCRPINGPLHPQVFSNRAEAIEFEIKYLNKTLLGV